MKLINDDNPFEKPMVKKEPIKQTMLRKSIAEIVQQ